MYIRSCYTNVQECGFRWMLYKLLLSMTIVILILFAFVQLIKSRRCLHIITSCKSTWDTVPYFGLNSLPLILCLWSLFHPLSSKYLISVIYTKVSCAINFNQYIAYEFKAWDMFTIKCSAYNSRLIKQSHLVLI